MSRSRMKPIYIFAIVYLCAQASVWKSLRAPPGNKERSEALAREDLLNAAVAGATTRRKRKQQKGLGVINKIAHLLRDNDNYTVPNTPGAFIHVSRTGGSTVQKMLKNGCHSFVTKPCQNLTHQDEAPLSKLTTYFHLPDFPHLTYDKEVIFRDYDFYVFTTRDPFDRAISAFLSSVPRNQIYSSFDWKQYNASLAQSPGKDPHKLETDMKHDLYVDLGKSKTLLAYSCFPTLQSFVDSIGDEPTNVETTVPWYKVPKDCTRVARLAILHKVDGMQHLFWDLNRLLETINGMNDMKPIMVIRNEFISLDWQNINRLLGHEGQMHVAEPPPTRIGDSSMFPVGKDLSADGRTKLCKALAHDYEIYFKLLSRALNLKDSDLEQSVVIAKRNCPALMKDKILESKP
jgi:hypothetical protein